MVRNRSPQLLAQIGKRRERIAIPRNEPGRVALDVGQSAKTVILQLKEPIRRGKGRGRRTSRVGSICGRMDMAFIVAQAWHSPANPAPCPRGVVETLHLVRLVYFDGLYAGSSKDRLPPSYLIGGLC